MDTQLLDKIKKLLEKAKSTDSEAEAQAFMNKVQQLLMENNLSMSQLEAHSVSEKDTPVTKSEVRLDDITDKRHGAWLSYLLNGICTANLSKAILVKGFMKESLGSIYVIGKEHNTIVVLGMFEYLRKTIIEIEKKSFKEYEGTQKRGAYRRDFLFACQQRVCQRLRENIQEMEAEEQRKLQAANQEKGLMILNPITEMMRINKEAVDKYIAQEYGALGKAKGTTQKYRDGTAAGSAAGGGINLSGQIGGSGGTKRIG